LASAYKVLVQGQLGNTVATLATVGASKSWVISKITVVNTDTSARTCGFYVGGTTNTKSITPETVSIPAGGMMEFTGAETLEAANTLSGGASVATKLTYTVFGNEVS
jgi:hypothetical protein